MSSFQNGGGDRYLEEIPGNARKFARRVKKNVEDWNFDGVDFFNLVGERGPHLKLVVTNWPVVVGRKWTYKNTHK